MAATHSPFQGPPLGLSWLEGRCSLPGRITDGVGKGGAARAGLARAHAPAPATESASVGRCPAAAAAARSPHAHSCPWPPACAPAHQHASFPAPQGYVRARILHFLDQPMLAAALGPLGPLRSMLQQAALHYTQAAVPRGGSTELALVFRHDCQ